MKWAAALAATLLALYLWARNLPEQHSVRHSRDLAAPPVKVFATISDFAALPQWRSGVKSVAYDAVRRRVVETSSMGELPYLIEAQEAPRLLRTKIDGGPELGFGGTWTFELEPIAQGTRITITERGEVPSLLFRWMSKYVFGHDKNVVTYLNDLERRLVLGKNLP